MLDSYSKAFFELAIDENKLEIVKEQFNLIKHLYKENLDFQKFLKAKSIDKTNKKQFLDKVLKNFDTIMINFLKVLIDNNKINFIPEIYIEFIKCYQEKNQIQFFEVSSARKLKEEEINKIKNELKKIFSVQIELKNIVDKTLIGGMKVSTNGVSLDNTIINQLEVLKTIL